MIVTKSELAEILGVSERTLSTWQQEGLPIENQQHQGNTYHTVKVIDWLKQHHANRLTESNGEILDLEAEKARLTKAQADAAELKLAEQKRQLLDANEVQAVWENNIMACRAKLLSLPSKIAPVVANETSTPIIESTIRDALYEALDELSRSEFDDSQSDLEATA
jgi:phage terminase Nu1 subunit (DNA packaging protein)